MDKWWRILTGFFIHKVLTDRGHTVRYLLSEKLAFKYLILLGFYKLCTGKPALNNNNKLTISNIY